MICIFWPNCGYSFVLSIFLLFFILPYYGLYIFLSFYYYQAFMGVVFIFSLYLLPDNGGSFYIDSAIAIALA